ncbi:MAG: hypothetical protein K2P81_03565 [Bacteriovoracaceae bacterium]|nr:hypothetical protein [Bacteriovoracaceae bacterium]
MKKAIFFLSVLTLSSFAQANQCNLNFSTDYLNITSTERAELELALNEKGYDFNVPYGAKTNVTIDFVRIVSKKDYESKPEMQTQFMFGGAVQVNSYTMNPNASNEVWEIGKNPKDAIFEVTSYSRAAYGFTYSKKTFEPSSKEIKLIMWDEQGSVIDVLKPKKPFLGLSSDKGSEGFVLARGIIRSMPDCDSKKIAAHNDANRENMKGYQPSGMSLSGGTYNTGSYGFGW